MANIILVVKGHKPLRLLGVIDPMLLLKIRDVRCEMCHVSALES